MQSLNYLRHLEQQIEAAQDLNKGQRTRKLLMYNCAMVMERSGIASDLVAQICAKSNVSRGTFYTYFEDSLAAVMAVMTDFLETVSTWISGLERRTDLFTSIKLLLSFDHALHAENSGLLRCLYVINPQVVTNRRPYRLWQKVRHGWRVALAQQLLLLLGLPKQDQLAALHVMYSLAGMADELMFQMYLADNPYFRRSVPSIDYLIETLAIIWFRSLTGRNPPARRLKTPARDVARLMKKVQEAALE